MKLWKNKDIRKEVLLGVLAICFAAWLGLRHGEYAGIVVFFLGIVLLAINLYFQRKRYQELARLSESIDKVLHGQEDVLITDNEEGELSILNSEINKMTVCLREQAEQLKSDKIALTDAIADISHQMRTPLTTMSLVISMLTEEKLSYEKRLQLIRELKRQMEKTHWLVEALLKISKIDAGTAKFVPEEISVATIVKKAAEPFLVPMELKGQQYKVSVADEKAVVDVAWTVEAISNLIKNCMEHTPEGGAVEVTVTETALYTEIIVADTGSGIDAEDLPHIFERFYKGKNATKESIGIGLALSRMIVVAQNGTISVENRREGGARFVVKFYKSIV